MNKEDMALFFWQRVAELNTTMPAVISKVNDNSINVRPVIARVYAEQIIEPPIVEDVPIIWPCGGGTNMTWPLEEGDYVLLVCAQRNIETWLGGEDFKPPPDSSLLELTDCFAIAGINPESKFLPIPEKPTLNGDFLINGNVEIQGSLYVKDETSIDSTLYVDSDVSCNSAVSVAASLSVSGESTLDGLVMANAGIVTPSISTGTLAFSSGGAGVDGEIPGDLKASGDVKAGNISLKTHVHSNGNNGAPTGGPM